MSRTNYIKIPKQNSFNFVELDEVDNISVFENETNTFEINSFNIFRYPENKVYQKKDRPSLQIHSNYAELSVILRDGLLNQTEIEMVKKSTNLDRFMSLQGNAYSNSNGKLAVYFSDGDVFDVDGEIIDNHSLNGDVPEFAVVGNIVNIGGLDFEIFNVTVDKKINKKVIVFDEPFVDDESTQILKCNYDLLNFEVYETNFDFSDVDSGYYDIVVKATSVADPLTELVYTKEFQSENIKIDDHFDRTVGIHYYNEDNKEMFYKYGIINFLRVFCSSIYKIIVQSSDANKNDDGSVLVKSSLNFGNKFLFENLNRKEAETLAIALSSENVFIQGLGYVKNSDLTFDNKENTNIYEIEAQMLETNVRLDLTPPPIPPVIPVGWTDLRLDGHEFVVGTDLRMREGMSMFRDEDGMYFSGVNPVASWVKFESEFWLRSEGKKIEWIFSTQDPLLPGGVHVSPLIGITSNNSNEISMNQHFFSEACVSYQSTYSFWSIRGNTGTLGEAASGFERITPEGETEKLLSREQTQGTIMKVVIENGGAFGSDVTFYELPDADFLNWDDESNIFSHGKISNNMGPDEEHLIPFLSPPNGGTQRFIAFRVT